MLVAAPEGIAALEKAHPDVELYTASVDKGLNEHGYIIPVSAMPATRFLERNKIYHAKKPTLRVGFFFE